MIGQPFCKGFIVKFFEIFTDISACAVGCNELDALNRNNCV